MNTKTRNVDTSAALVATPLIQERLPYCRPSLKTFGLLRDLTDGGSGAITEAAAGNMGSMNRQ